MGVRKFSMLYFSALEAKFGLQTSNFKLKEIRYRKINLDISNSFTPVTLIFGFFWSVYSIWP